MSPQVLPGAAPAGAQEQQQQGGGSGGGGGGVSSEVLELVDLFLAAQGQRAAAYCRFDAAFRAYLQNGAEGPYRHTITQLTAQFADLSRQVIVIEEALKARQQGELAALLRTVQEHEREKLRLTLGLHALKAAHAQQRFSWQHEEAAAAGMAPGVADLLQGHLCGVGCVHQAPADEPTQAEYAGAVRETYQLLQASIMGINEALEEARQAQADLLEQ